MNIAKKSLLVALLAGIGFSAFAQERVYVIDQRDVVAKSGFGLCWRTGYWTPAAAAADKAGCECDKDLLPKGTCDGAAAAAPAAAQGAAPAVAAPKPAGEKITVAADALFDFNKAVLRPEGKAKLDELADKLGQVNVETIVATGHTDSVGTDAYNQGLSVRRANTVKAYLVSKGVAAERVLVEGKGETQPVASNATKDGRAQNRRVVVEVVGVKK